MRGHCVFRHKSLLGTLTTEQLNAADDMALPGRGPAAERCDAGEILGQGTELQAVKNS